MIVGETTEGKGKPESHKDRSKRENERQEQRKEG